VNQDNINFLQARDFGETFNVSVKFVRQNFKIYFLSLLFLAGPFIMLYSFSGAYYESVILHKLALVKAGLLYNMTTYSWEYFVSLFFQFVSALALLCTNYSFMAVYHEKGVGNFKVGDVARKMKQHLSKIIGGFFLFLILTIIFGVAIVVVVSLIINGSRVAGFVLLISLMVGLLIIGPNLLWQFSTSFLVMISENEIAFTAFGRTREVMKSNYWWTWLVSVCGSLITMFISLMFALPMIVFTLVKTFTMPTDGMYENSIIYLIVFVISSFFSSMVYVLLHVVSGFHYFSLAEKRDGTGLMERINEIGNQQQQFNNVITQQ
jgi:hypothetical protein